MAQSIKGILKSASIFNSNCIQRRDFILSSTRTRKSDFHVIFQHHFSLFSAQTYRFYRIPLLVLHNSLFPTQYLPVSRNISPKFSISSKSRMANETRGPIEMTIVEKLTKSFEPIHLGDSSTKILNHTQWANFWRILEVMNESYMHSVPKGSETHFKVVIVSNKFENVKLIDRHRMVNDALSHELKTGVHALSIHAKTVKQWEDSNHSVSQSPACMGGMKKEAKT